MVLMQATEALYLADTTLMSLQGARVMALRGDKDVEVALDRTVFHPRGGGQPADKGTLGGQPVEAVTRDADGVIWHRLPVEMAQLGWKEGDFVDLNVDADWRSLHARLHSAGHLLDVAVRRAGYDALFPTKGNHEVGSCSVEYKGDLSAEERQTFRERVENCMLEVVKDDLKMIASVDSKTGHRHIRFGEDDPGCGCGGTHVARSSMIGKVRVTQVKRKRGDIRVSYEVLDGPV
jgi:alanyl-tRNA synthetase